MRAASQEFDSAPLSCSDQVQTVAAYDRVLGPVHVEQVQFDQEE